MTTMVQDMIEREVVYPASPERVWAALTEPDQIRRWFCNEGAEIDLRPGGAIRLSWSHGTSRAIVETVDPPHQFAFRWAPGYNGEDPNRPIEEQPLTLVAFTLEPVDGGTRLRLVESGFAALDESRRIAALKDNSGGWDECLAGLSALLGAGDGR